MAAKTRPEHLHYDYVENHFLQSINSAEPFLFDRDLFDMELRELSEKFGFPYRSLASFVRNLNLRHIKKTAGKVRARLPSYLQDYQDGKASILELAARKANYPPFLLARFMTEAIAAIPKKKLTDAMRDPQKVLSSRNNITPEYHDSEEKRLEWKQAGTLSSSAFGTRLAYEVDQALRSDPMNGPMLDKERHLLGVEYEVVLEHQLRQLGIPFETEEDLRDKGTARTPDVLLSCPVGIPVATTAAATTEEEEWTVICWIDSKALFGDTYTHNTSVLPQAESYVNRFGPGLILYWFGHAPPERLNTAGGEIVVTGWELPRKLMLPPGEVIGPGTNTAG